LSEEVGNGTGLSVEGQQWLRERTQPGNWIKIAPDEEFPSCLHGTPWVTLVHMFQIAFTPEIERRIAAGLIDDAFFVNVAQLITRDGGKQEVRFNDEVRGVGRVRVNQPVQKGDPVPFSDLAGMENFDVEEVELDCGHFTMFYSNPGWRIFFNFNTGRAKSFGLIERAAEFLAAARYSAEQGHAGPAIDNLFSACELLSKARLILIRSPAVQSKSHGSIGSAINAWRKLGNVDAAFVDLFNRMSNEREGARYTGSKEVAPPSIEEFELVATELQLLKQSVQHKG
jgi:hypothetical protein